MAKNDNKVNQPRKDAEKKEKAATSAKMKKNKKTDQYGRKINGRRETIESVVVAFILAFLFRTFEAEAFVIPTGSMAPTLLGRHKECECKECGYRFPIGASDEVEQPGLLKPDDRIRSAVCPNCRAVVPASTLLDLPVFKGDRILVNKYPYEFGDPDRWDVVVFKFPEEPNTNYIKRLVGKPGEKLEIRQGNVYVISEKGILKILRKDDLKKQRQLQILVYDNDFPARKLEKGKDGFPQRWAAVIQNNRSGSIDGWSETKDTWIENDDERAFHLDSLSNTSQYRWLRYRHFVASEDDWSAVRKGNSPSMPMPQLITDFCGYNAYVTGSVVKKGNRTAAEFKDALQREERRDAENRKRKIGNGLFWVSELTINCKLNVKEIGKNAELVLELNAGQRKYRCTIDVNSGIATLKHNDAKKKDEKNEKSIDWIKLATAETDVKETGEYRLSFANVDHRLSLWVNDKLIDFGTRCFLVIDFDLE
ncbi:MAG: signal peptidase I [Planctomycetes bacterium]|nr:signal peptidase I [Planctomycetota bacterium]